MQNYRNIIFDLGGVVLDIDYNLTIEAFRELGIRNAEDLYSKAKQDSIFDNLEKGLIGDEEFFDELRKRAGLKISNNDLRNAWNALIISLPSENVELLKSINKTHRIFLLSNTNAIHEPAYRKLIERTYGSAVLDELFEKTYLSHHIHMRKPDPEIFEYVLKDAGLKREETLFIDDSPQHVHSAQRIGIPSYHLDHQTLSEYFKSFDYEIKSTKDLNS